MGRRSALTTTCSLTHWTSCLALAVEPARDVRPRFRADNPKIDELVDEAWAAVLVHGTIYRQGTRLVAVDHSPDGELEITPLDEYGLLYHLSENADFYKQKSVSLPGSGPTMGRRTTCHPRSSWRRS